MFRPPVLFFAFTLALSGQSYRETLLTSALQRDPQNLHKILELAALKLEEASAITNEGARASSLDEVQILYLKANALDSRNVDALYHLGVVSWMKVFPAVVAARRDAAMEPETPGPVRDRSSRAVLNARYRADIDYAIASLEQAVAIDPSNNDAMAYLQMAYRARADLKDTRAQWDEDQYSAGHWREKAYEVGTAKEVILPASLDKRATHPPIAPWSVVFMPSAVPVDSRDMQKKLLHSTVAGCPGGPHMAGNIPPVTLSAIIDRDGSVLYLERLEGPDEAVPAAVDAARQWSYQPILINGKATMVKTSLVVSFQHCSAN